MSARQIRIDVHIIIREPDQPLYLFYPVHEDCRKDHRSCAIGIPLHLSIDSAKLP